MKYKKSQIGWLVIGTLALITFFLYLAYANQWGDSPLTFIPFVLIAALFLFLCCLFYQLTIELDGGALKLTYGIGLIKFKFRIDEFERAEVIKTPWQYGIGIRVTPKGMLYNIQGSKAVLIKFSSEEKNKSIMIGSQEPFQLKEAIEKNIKN